jgi:hypothetical protein
MGAVRLHKPFHSGHHVQPDGAAEAAVLQWRLCPLDQHTVAKNPAQHNVPLKEIMMHHYGICVGLRQAEGCFLTALGIEGTDKG